MEIGAFAPRFLFLAVFAGALAAALVQAVDSLALATYAVAPSWMSYVPLSWRQAAGGAIDGGFPAPAAAHLALVRVALDAGDLDLAARRVAALAPSPDRNVFEGRIAQRRGDLAAAGVDYARGGDAESAARLIDALDAAGNLAGALDLQKRVIAGLPVTPGNAAARADAWWRLGQLYQSQAYALPIAARGSLERRAADAYDRAAELAPLSAKFVLAAGNERLNLDDVAAARRAFDALLGQDPHNEDALLGLADAAIRAGDVEAARGFLRRAQVFHDDARVEAALGSLPK
jgi:tetratricopeptide (TPR) repeat protein